VKPSSLLALLLPLATLPLASCGDDAAAPAPPQAPPTAPAAAAPAPGKPEDSGGMRFEEVARRAGIKFHMTFLRPEQGETFRINLYDHGAGVCVADVDGDGKEDIYLLNQLGPNGLFRNRGDGTFEDVTAASGTGLEEKICVGGVFGDADGDGDQDLYVTTVRAGNVYLENDGKGRFRDATKEAGLTLVAESMSPCFFDAEGDGDLDLIVTNTARWTLETFSEGLHYWEGKWTLEELIDSEKQYDVFYLNDGKGRFTDATEKSGLKGKGWGGDVAVFDLEGDGDLDVFVCNMFGSSSLYANDGKGVFTEVTREVLGRTSWGAVGARVIDYDDDGLLDIFVADMHSDMWIPFDMDPSMVREKEKYGSFYGRAVKEGWATAEKDRQFDVQAAIRKEEVVFGSTLFRNLGGGKYEEVSDRAGWETFWPWGIVDGDYDLDGHQDIFIPSGMGYPLFHWRCSLLRNRGDGTFGDVSGPAGIDPPPGGPWADVMFKGKRGVRSSRAAATLDVDGDGLLDLVVNTFNDRAWLFRNTSPKGTWCGLKLVGTRLHRDAIGAVVRLTAGGRTMTRQVQAAGGYLSQSTSVLHFGLAGASKVEKVEITWPGGQAQTLTDVPVGKVTVVTEPK
jgi:hypothetical protein